MISFAFRNPRMNSWAMFFDMLYELVYHFICIL